MSKNAVSWKTLVRQIVDEMPRTFTLSDITARRDYFARHYPENRFIEPKIRQTLQLLRDQGVVRFLGAGHYERTGDKPAFSALIHPDLAVAYRSGSQVARVVIETWAELNLYCLNCAQDSLTRHPANFAASDFYCADCDSQYQVKSKNGRFGPTITGAEYGVTFDAAVRGAMPEHVLVEYNLPRRSVVFVDAVPGNRITSDRIIARKPLAKTARRAGWTGCTIKIDDLPRTRIVAPTGIEQAAVRQEWIEACR